MIKSIFIFVIFISAVSHAKLAGDWTGWGNWSFKGQPPGADCTLMKMSWSESVNSISIDSGFFDCQVAAMHLEKTSWKLQAGHLFDEAGVDVGTYDGNNLDVRMPSPNENTMIDISVKRSANHYDYQEVWFNKVEKIYVITGRLFTSGK